MRLAMAIDTTACVGCNTCAVTCKVSNNVPNNIMWNRVMTEGGDFMDAMGGQYPNCSITYYPIACQHCSNPACTKVCPVGATYIDEETGAVLQDWNRCIGCRMCIASCPYTGIRSFNWEEPAYYLDVKLGVQSIPAHEKHTVEKCTFCKERREQGMEPACIEVCPMRARVFGDLDDPDSEISQLVASREYKQLLPEKGTKPSVYYLV